MSDGSATANDIADVAAHLNATKMFDAMASRPAARFNEQKITAREHGMLLEYQGQIYRDPVSGQNMHEALGALIKSPAFAQMPDPQRAATIKDTVMYLDRPNEAGNWHYYVQIYFNVGNMSTQQVTARYGKLVELKNNTSAIGGGTGSGSGVGSGGGSSGGGGTGGGGIGGGGGPGDEMPVIS